MKKFFSFLNRITINTTILISLVALYQATILNFTYYREVLNRLDLISINDILFFMSMPVTVFCVIFALLNLCIFAKLIKFIAVIFIMVGSALSYFMSNFRIMIDRDMLQNALETTSAESSALITPTLLLTIIILGVLPALCVIFVKITPVKNKWYYLLRRLFSVLIAFIGIFIVAFFFYKNYATFMRNNHSIIKYLTPSNYIAAVYNQYDYVMSSNQPFITIGQDAYQRKSENQSDNKKTLMILLIGETARAKNFSLGGYEKQTNPLLSKRDVIYFDNTSSCGTFTAYSLPCMFSNMPRKEYDPKLAARQSNALDILQRSGINILWQENDSGCKGVCERVPTVDLTNKYQSSSSLCKNGTCYDEILYEGVKEYIEKEDDNDKLIVLHTIGSHGPTYYQRYPEKAKIFQPTCDTNEINRCTQEELINTYDNTIVYTDLVIDQAISLSEQYQDQYNTVVVYISDHGESLGENGIYLHSMPYSVAPDEQTQIPFILWLSDGFKKQYEINQECLQQNSQQLEFSQDNLFHSLLGVFNIETREYQENLDILQACKIVQPN